MKQIFSDWAFNIRLASSRFFSPADRDIVRSYARKAIDTLPCANQLTQRQREVVTEAMSYMGTEKWDKVYPMLRWGFPDYLACAITISCKKKFSELQP